MTMIAAEAVSWPLAVLAVFLCGDWLRGRDSFEIGMIPSLAFFAWRMVLPVLVHCGLRLVVTLGVVIELALYPGFYRYALTWELHLAIFGVCLLPLVLLWLPPSIRWIRSRKMKDSSVHASTISGVAIYEKNEGARTDSHPENPEDGSKAPFTDSKIALYLSYVNGGGNERG